MSERNRIIGVFVISILSIGLTAYFGLNSIKKFDNSGKWVYHTQKVINEVQQLVVYCQDIETSVRGFAITEEEKYLQTYEESVKGIEQSLKELERLTKDNDRQHIIVGELYLLVHEKVDFTRETANLCRSKGKMEAQKRISSHAGQHLMDSIKKRTKSLIKYESKLLVERQKLNAQNYSSTFRSIVLAIISSLVILIVAMFVILRSQNRRDAVEKEVRDSRFRLRQFLDNVPLPIFIIDLDRKPVYANREALNIMGLNEISEVKYDSMYGNLYHAETGEKYTPMDVSLSDIFKQQTEFEITNLMLKQGDKFIELNIRSLAVTDADGSIKYAMSVIQDVTAQKERERALEKAKKNAEESDKQKEIFLTNMSHEMRTPMNAIVGFSLLLSETNLNKQQSEFLESIRVSSDNLLHIINDILDLSKIQSGYLKLERLDFELEKLVQELQALHQVSMDEKNLLFTVKVDRSLPKYIEGDPQRLKQIMNNLLSNAAKFTSKGSVDVKLSLKEKISEEQFLLEIEVSDTGIGIDEEKLPFIFDRFTQADFNETRAYGGAGLGLNITKFIVEKLGGSIRVDSKKNVGTTFTVRLPYWFSTDEKSNLLAETESKQSLGENKTTARILLVEDNFLNRKLAKLIIEGLGYQLDMAEHGKQAFEKVDNAAYDLILMDLQMPELDGYQTTEILRKDRKLLTSIIAMTAHSLEGERAKCMEIGMDDYISKPFQVEELKSKIANGIGLTRKRNSEKQSNSKWEQLKLLFENKEFMQAKMLLFALKQNYADSNGAFDTLELKIQQGVELSDLLSELENLKQGLST